jgi:asparaginyl-tRNA synthetase
LRTIAHLRPRTNTFSAVFRLRSAAAYAIHRFFQERGFVYVQTPIITGSDCEGAGEMFRVTTLDFDDIPRDEKGCVDFTQDFFGKQTSLTVSASSTERLTAWHSGKYIHSVRHSEQKIQIRQDMPPNSG